MRPPAVASGYRPTRSARIRSSRIPDRRPGGRFARFRGYHTPPRPRKTLYRQSSKPVFRRSASACNVQSRSTARCLSRRMVSGSSRTSSTLRSAAAVGAGLVDVTPPAARFSAAARSVVFFILALPASTRTGSRSGHRGRSRTRALTRSTSLRAGADDSSSPGCIAGRVALDVDQGDPAALVQEYPPLALLPATRGSHAYYVDAQAGDRRSGPFRSVRFGVAGDVIAGPRSFLRLDHDEHNVVELAERIVFGPDRWFFPDKSASIGTRNNALFLALQQWALPRETGHSRADWERAVVEQARALNATMRDPLADYEVAATGRSVAGWRWGLPASAHAAAFRALQAERGRAGHGESKAKGGRAGKRKADPASARSTRPWEAAGVSRATWYRRKKGALRPDNNLYQGGPIRAPAEPAA